MGSDGLVFGGAYFRRGFLSEGSISFQNVLGITKLILNVHGFILGRFIIGQEGFL